MGPLAELGCYLFDLLLFYLFVWLRFADESS